MQRLKAIFRGNRIIELLSDISLPKNSFVEIEIPLEEEERVSFMKLTEQSFGFWENPEEDIYQDYLPEMKK